MKVKVCSKMIINGDLNYISIIKYQLKIKINFKNNLNYNKLRIL